MELPENIVSSFSDVQDVLVFFMAQEGKTALIGAQTFRNERKVLVIAEKID